MSLLTLVAVVFLCLKLHSVVFCCVLHREEARVRVNPIPASCPVVLNYLIKNTFSKDKSKHEKIKLEVEVFPKGKEKTL